MSEETRPDLNLLCRLCLADDSDNSHHIFNEGLSNKIIILSGLEVQQNDALPKNICRDCRYQLEKSYYFRMVAKQSDSRLRRHIRLLNQNKPSNVLSKDYEDDETEEFQEMFLESYKYFEAAEQTIATMREKFEEEKQDIIKVEVEKTKLSPLRSTRSRQIPENPVVLNKCAPSNQRFEEVPKLLRRQKQEKPLKSSQEKPANSSIVSEIVLEGYEIEILSTQEDEDESQQFSQFEIIEENVLLAEENIEEACSGSDEDYKPPVEKKSPVAKRKTNRKKEKSKTSISKATTKATKSDQPIEPTDDLYFKAMDDSEDLDENGEKKIFQCAFEGCLESFARRQACKTHFYNHLASRTVTNGYNCQFCQKTFKVASALERHERVHTGDKPFLCDHAGCGKAFSQKEMLKRHKAIHLSMDDAPFACHICDKKFRQKEPLRQHINKMHSEDSADIKSHPFGCTICNKQFAHSSGLSRHLLIHSGRRFTCEVCSKVFNDQSALKRHRSIHIKSK